MKPEHILQSDVLDIVFENRNKAYGAYELRKHYRRRLIKSLLITISIVALFALLQSWKVPHKTISIVSVQDLNPLQLVEMELQKEKPESLPVVKQNKQVASVDYQTPVIVKDELVKDSLPTVDDIADKLISDKNTDGEKITENTILSPANDRNNKDITTGVKEEVNYDLPLKTAEIMPQFPGGMEAFMKFMQRNVQQPEDLEEGRKMVVIASFVVDAAGNIINIGIEQRARPDLDAEVMRVLKKMPVWEPGKQNGRNVPVFFRLPVTFISGE